MDAWWRANNYLTVGQIYLQSEPLAPSKLTFDDIKPRLLGHWGRPRAWPSSTPTSPIW